MTPLSRMTVYHSKPIVKLLQVVISNKVNTGIYHSKWAGKTLLTQSEIGVSQFVLLTLVEWCLVCLMKEKLMFSMATMSTVAPSQSLTIYRPSF